MEYFASLETGGTKCVCTIGTSPDDIFDITTFPTLSPKETIPKIISYFAPKIKDYNIKKMGITSFGPIDLHRESNNFGYITTTPKIAWQQIDLVGQLSDALSIEKDNIAFDTDVNGAALAEGTWGAAKGLNTYTYVTVGTGIGIGLVVNGSLLHGMLHPDGGHIILPLHPKDPSEGFCPFHKNCWEGLASGFSVDKRWNMPASEIPDSHFAWELESHYLALGIVNLICTISPQRIILGGGISKRSSIFQKTREKVTHLLNKYIQTKEILEDIDNYIVPPTLEHSGLLGGIILAKSIR